MSYRAKAIVIDYRPETRMAMAKVIENGLSFSFSSTSFYAGQFSRVPSLNEEVLLVIDDKTFEVLAAFAEKRN